MEEGISKVRCLLGVQLYELSNKYISELRKKHKTNESIFKLLPEYTINTNEKGGNSPILANYFLQFVDYFKDENLIKYLLFDLITIDNLLLEEISNTGAEDLFKDFDFIKILSFFTPHNDYDMSRYITPITRYLIVEITYDISYDHYSGGYDCESNVNIIGYLNENLEPHYYFDLK